MFSGLSLPLVKIVFFKEWRDAVRDKRAMRLAWIPVIYFIGLFIASFYFMLNLQQQHENDGITSVDVPVAGISQLPALQNWLVEQGARLQSIEGDAAQRVQQGELELALLIDHGSAEKRARGEAVNITLLYDASNQNVHQKLGFVRGLIYGFNAREGSINLMARGISPEVTQPLRLSERNLASEQRMGIYVLGSLPMMLILMVFICGIGFSADMTAGERERRSLESVDNAINASSLILGKWLTSVAITIMVFSVMLIALGVALSVLPFSELGVRVSVSIPGFLLIGLAMLPLMALAVALQLMISLYARSFKDAQTYTSIMVLVPVVATFYLLFNPGSFESWFYWIPIMGQQLGVRETLLGNNLSLSSLGIFWLVDIALMLLCLRVAAGKLRQASVVYG